jgi:hypothetical protein
LAVTIGSRGTCCRTAETALEVSFHIFRAVADQRAQLHVGAALPKEPVAAYAGDAALRDAGILAFREKGF